MSIRVELLAIKFIIWMPSMYNSDLIPPILIKDFPYKWKSKKLASSKLNITDPFCLVSIWIKSLPITLKAVKII